MGHDGRAEHPRHDLQADLSKKVMSGVDISDDYVQAASEIASAARMAALAKVADAARHRRGEFRWYEFLVRRRYRSGS